VCWGVGVWGLGVGPNTQLPTPQSPIPNPQVFSFVLLKSNINLKKYK